MMENIDSLINQSGEPIEKYFNETSDEDLKRDLNSVEFTGKGITVEEWLAYVDEEAKIETCNSE